MTDGLQKLKRVVTSLRLIDDTMPIQWIAILLQVAENEGASISEISQKVGLALSSTSRNVSAMSDWHWLKKPGLGLLVKQVDRMDLTKQQVSLSPKGKKLVEQLRAILGEEVTV